MSEELIDREEAEKIATDYAKGRFEGSKINSVSVELTEVSGIAIYKVEGTAIFSTKPKKSFSAQINAKNGKVLGFKEVPTDLYKITGSR